MSTNKAEPKCPACKVQGIDKLLYTSNVSGNWQIYASNANGANPVNLSNNFYNEFTPDW